MVWSTTVGSRKHVLSTLACRSDGDDEEARRCTATGSRVRGDRHETIPDSPVWVRVRRPCDEEIYLYSETRTYRLLVRTMVRGSKFMFPEVFIVSYLTPVSHK